MRRIQKVAVLFGLIVVMVKGSVHLRGEDAVPGGAKATSKKPRAAESILVCIGNPKAGKGERELLQMRSTGAVVWRRPLKASRPPGVEYLSSAREVAIQVLADDDLVVCEADLYRDKAEKMSFRFNLYRFDAQGKPKWHTSFTMPEYDNAQGYSGLQTIQVLKNGEVLVLLGDVMFIADKKGKVRDRVMSDDGADFDGGFMFPHHLTGFAHAYECENGEIGLYCVGEGFVYASLYGESKKGKFKDVKPREISGQNRLYSRQCNFTTLRSDKVVAFHRNTAICMKKDRVLWTRRAVAPGHSNSDCTSFEWLEDGSYLVATDEHKVLRFDKENRIVWKREFPGKRVHFAVMKTAPKAPGAKPEEAKR